MVKITVVGIDLAKAHWQVHAEDSNEKVLLRKAMKPEKAIAYLANLGRCVVGMEVCGSAHYWARRIRELGHDVRLVPPQFVRAYVRGNHNDIRDAEAIAEVVQRRNIRFVPIKEEEHQDLQNLHRIRERIKRNRVALSNQIRGILYEYGISFRQGDASLRKNLAIIFEERRLSSLLLEQLSELREEYLALSDRLTKLDNKLKNISKHHDVCARLESIPGVGPLIATAILASVSRPSAFRNGRHMACWLGLVPGHRHTGGPTKKRVMLGITKRGDRYLRTLLIQGARAWLIAAKRQNTQAAKKALKLVEQKGYNKAAVAVAHRNARVIWALMNSDESYNAAVAA